MLWALIFSIGLLQVEVAINGKGGEQNEKKIESIAKEILLYMIDLERYGWPPSCTGIVYQPERPYAIKQQTDNKSLKSTD